VSFGRLSPALQSQIVSGLGWAQLRPVQEQTIAGVLDGDNCVVLAPTAGGKTEAALFPVLSAMHEGRWAPTSALYVAPIRALLNNQEARLQELASLLGRRAAKWHGDVTDAARRRFVREPADLLATTPESLEALLMSTRLPGRQLLSQVQVVIIDEVHAFAADDRGAHLMALLERIAHLAGRDIQRIGLSATVGDPAEIADWLSGSSARRRRVIDPGGARKTAEVVLDHVGSLEGAASIIERLHPGRRRLVFVDSRRRVEALGSLLSAKGIHTFLSHSSLSLSQRAAAERAFAEERDCVIVATSSLELGLDVGDLDHVYQIDAPSTVSSFLQRMGRTGRRADTRPNCTFLTTSDEGLLQAAGLLHCWRQGFVEPAAPSRRAAHVLAHQLLALAAGAQGLNLDAALHTLRGAAPFRDLDPQDGAALAAHMLAADILTEADGRLLLGAEGERRYGRRNFLELYAVFSAPSVLTVWHGAEEIGTIDAWFLLGDDKPGATFVLGGRAWALEQVVWSKGTASVRPAPTGAAPRWLGQPRLLSRPLCEGIRDVLVGDDIPAEWSRRARAALMEERETHEALRDEESPLVAEGKNLRWWTFAGGKANNLRAALLRRELGDRVSANNLSITIADEAARSDVAVRGAIRGLVPTWEEAEALVEGVARGPMSKFQPCLPERLARRLMADRLMEP
jgi:ATP-dependent Lhr-like helicase